MLYKWPFWYHWQNSLHKIYFLLFSFISTFFISFIYRLEVFYFLGQVFIKFNKNLIYTKVSTGFWMYFKLSLWVSFFFILPLILYFTFLFLLKGFPKYQGLLTYFLSMFVFVFYFLIISLSLHYFFPFIFSFFLSFENTNGLIILELEARFDQYLLFITNYFLFVMWIFLLPFCFIIINQFFKESLRQIRYYIYISSVVSFLLVAPPDFVLQLFLIILLVLITEIMFFIFFIIKNVFNNIIEESRIRTCDE